MTVIIQRWFREKNDDGTVTTWAESIRYSSLYEARPAYQRLLEKLNDPSFAREGVEWGVTCPELDAEEELAPVSDRARWLKEIRRVRLGQAKEAPPVEAHPGQQ